MAAKQEIDLSFLKQSYDEIELPSRGLPYTKDNPFSKGKIHIRPWLTPEEKIIDKFDRGNFYSIIGRLVGSVIEERVNIETLTDADLFFILYWIRSITYGSTYSIETTCPHCGNKVKVKINIYDYPIKYLSEFEEPFTVLLPSSGIELKMRLPRVGDLIKSTETKHSDLYKMGTTINPDIYRFALCTSEMILPNANKDVLNENDMENYLPFTLKKIWTALPANDIVAIRKAISKFEHGYIDNVEVKCSECEKYFEQAPLLEWNFFRPSNRESSTDSELSLDI